MPRVVGTVGARTLDGRQFRRRRDGLPRPSFLMFESSRTRRRSPLSTWFLAADVKPHTHGKAIAAQVISTWVDESVGADFSTQTIIVEIFLSDRFL
jgi:hypothetical protein